MLQFYGIEQKAGDTFRFAFRIDLTSAILKSLKMLEFTGDDVEASLDKIRQDIESLGPKEKPLKDVKNVTIKRIKLQLKHLYLVRDILLFFSLHKHNLKTIKGFLELLAKDVKIEQKCESAVQFLSVSKQVLCPKGLTKEILHQDSLINQLIKVIRLVLLEQIPDKPPANLKLAFVPKKFPAHNWFSTEFSDYKRVLNWEPNAANFSLLQLRTLLLQSVSLPENSSKTLPVKYDTKNDNLLTARNKLNVLHSHLKSEQILTNGQQLNENAYQFDNLSQNIEFFLADKAKQPRILPTRPWESLFDFQNDLRKKYTNTGVIIFYAILRQLIPKYGENKVEFDVEAHLQLLSTKKKLTQKNRENFWQKTLAILQELQKIEVKRQSKCGRYEKQNQLLIMFGKLSKKPGAIPQKLYLDLDDVFIGKNSMGVLPFGAVYVAIPASFFGLKISASLKEVLNFMVFFTSNWIYGIEQHNGVLVKSLRQIIEGSCMEVSKSDKYRAVYRSLSAIRYMKENNLIADYNLRIAPGKDQWENTCVISANRESLNLIRNLHNTLIKPTIGS